MSRYKPTMYYKDIHSINYDKLKKDGIKCLVFDLDNTLGLLDDIKCPEKTKKLIQKLKKDFLVLIMSNSRKKRIEPYANDLGVDAITFALKPLIHGHRKLKKKYNLKKEEMVIIGDQIVTDIVSGKRFKIKTILVDPLGEKDLKITSINRKIEKRILNKYKKKGIFERGKYYE